MVLKPSNLAENLVNRAPHLSKKICYHHICLNDNLQLYNCVLGPSSVLDSAILVPAKIYPYKSKGAFR